MPSIWTVVDSLTRHRHVRRLAISNSLCPDRKRTCIQRCETRHLIPTLISIPNFLIHPPFNKQPPMGILFTSEQRTPSTSPAASRSLVLIQSPPKSHRPPPSIPSLKFPFVVRLHAWTRNELKWDRLPLVWYHWSKNWGEIERGQQVKRYHDWWFGARIYTRVADGGVPILVESHPGGYNEDPMRRSPGKEAGWEIQILEKTLPRLR